MTHDFDVVVVGAGNAALTAALSAAENGARVLVVEKAPKAVSGGNSRFSGALFRFAYRSVEDLKPLRPEVAAEDWQRVDVGSYDADAYFDEMMQVTRGRADPILIRTLVEQSYSTVLWMKNLGVQWEWTELWSSLSETELRFNPGAVLEVGNKGIGLMATLFEAVAAAGVEVAYETKMTGFLADEKGALEGIQVRTPSGRRELRTGAVILASGGFEANTEMRARYLGPGWDQVKVRGTRFNTGETLRLALELGARAVGHWQGCHATPIDGDAPAVGDLRLTDRTNRLSYPLSVMVNADAERFIDEGEDLGGLTYAKTGRSILEQPGAVAYQIFDHKTVGLLEERYSTGSPLIAASIEELAKRLGLAPQRLKQTVDDYNAAVGEGDFDPGARDGKSTRGLEPPKSNWAQPLDTPPYTAYSTTCGITFTYGGIQIDSQARVIDTEGDPIPGLFATGEITGGFFHYNYPGGAGLMRGAVFGRIAGRTAALRSGNAA